MKDVELREGPRMDLIAWNCLRTAGSGSSGSMWTLTICNSPLGPLRFETAARPGAVSWKSEWGKSLSSSLATQ
eukprot:4773821-Pyramimonas_sp.AAC.1